MSDLQVLEKPSRWDIPFSREVADPNDARDMTDAEIDALLALEPFCHMDQARFPKNMDLRGILKNDTRILNYHDGDVVVRQGDYGNSAFLVLGGAVRVILEGLDASAIGRRSGTGKSFLKSVIGLFKQPKSPEVRDSLLYPQRGDVPGDPSSTGTLFVQDVANVLQKHGGVFEGAASTAMQEGSLFGELAALGRIPRSATIVASGHKDAKKRKTRLLEIRWQGLRDLRKYDEALREHVDNQFRKFGLASTLKSSPLLRNLDDSALAEISAQAKFEMFGQFDWYGSYNQLRKKDADPLSQEPKIAQEGDYPNGLVLIQSGFARLSHKHGNGEHTYGYMGKGDIYGLAEVLHNARGGDPIELNATLRAIGYVDVVHIPTSVVEQHILPHIDKRELDALLNKMKTMTEVIDPGYDEDPNSGIDPAMMEFLVENRIMNGTETMMIDLDRCTRCDDCVRACASGHTNNPRFVRHGKVHDHFMIANACMHCADPVCMIGCPTGAIHRLEGGGHVVINDITCIGCGTCANSCPYENIRLVEVRDKHKNDAMMVDPVKGNPIVKATKCDLCFEHHGGPACERACPHDALRRVDMHDLPGLEKFLNR